MSDGIVLVLKVVAVTVGVLCGGFLGNVLAPWLTRSRRGQSGFLISGALLGGFVMWLAVSHSGGGSGHGNGGTGPNQIADLSGPGKDKGLGGDKDRGSTKDKNATPGTDKDKNATKPAEPAVLVGVLGGDRVIEQRFYVLERQPARNKTELEQAILEKKRQDPSLKTIEIVLYLDSVPQDSEAVTTLEEWAKSNGFTHKVSFVNTPTP